MQDTRDLLARHQIHVIDTGLLRPRFDAAYLIVENGRGALIDCGTSHAVPHILAAIEAAGLTPENIDWLILTHIHLDHAGGAGALLQQLPNAQVAVHPRGAPHMIDPTRLVAGATAVYGEEEMARTYGRIMPIPESRLQRAGEGFQIDLQGRQLHCLDTPGHAAHHICIHDPRSGCIFTGDTFGISYRELDGENGPFIYPTTSPVQFDPDAMKNSLERLIALEPEAVCITHYGPIPEPRKQAETLHDWIDQMVAGALPLEHADDRHAALVELLAGLYLPRASRHSGLDPESVRKIIAVDLELNAQGLAIWMDRRRRRMQRPAN